VTLGRAGTASRGPFATRFAPSGSSWIAGARTRTERRSPTTTPGGGSPAPGRTRSKPRSGSGSTGSTQKSPGSLTGGPPPGLTRIRAIVRGNPLPAISSLFCRKLLGCQGKNPIPCRSLDRSFSSPWVLSYNRICACKIFASCGELIRVRLRRPWIAGHARWIRCERARGSSLWSRHRPRHAVVLCGFTDSMAPARLKVRDWHRFWSSTMSRPFSI